jgi:hypothetical protein
MPDGNDRIKSALEIALEKAQRLGSLSDVEKQSQKDGELAAAGAALVERYLNGLPLSDIELELAKRSEEDRGKVRSRILSHLVDMVDIKQTSTDDKVLAAIGHLFPDSELAQIIGGVFQEYRTAMDKARQDNLSRIESDKRTELERKGISGPAVDPAIETSPDWIRIEQDLSSHYEQRLDEIKRNLPAF